jgi:hypothetical protein
MQTAALTGKFCSQHDLLFFPSLQEWLPFTRDQIRLSFGDSIALEEETCPKCLQIAHLLFQAQFPQLYSSI